MKITFEADSVLKKNVLYGSLAHLYSSLVFIHSHFEIQDTVLARSLVLSNDLLYIILKAVRDMLVFQLVIIFV